MSVENLAFERVATLFHAVGDVTRLKLLVILAQGERCLQELVNLTHDDAPTVSHRLKLLLQSGLINKRRSGKFVYYYITEHSVNQFTLQLLQTM